MLWWWLFFTLVVVFFTLVVVFFTLAAVFFTLVEVAEKRRRQSPCVNREVVKIGSIFGEGKTSGYRVVYFTEAGVSKGEHEFITLISRGKLPEAENIELMADGSHSSFP